MNTFGEFTYEVRSYECGPDGAATLASVMNYMQEAASRQAEASGFSRSDFERKGLPISWIVTRIHLKLRRYPRWRENVRVVTWPAAGHSIVINRDWELFAGEEKIGWATSEWMLIDLNTRKLTMIPQYVFDSINDERSRSWPDHAFARMRWTCRTIAEDATLMRARRGDIDLNGHVNNVRYVEWLIEALPADAGVIEDFEICFKSETMAGDAVAAEAVETEPGRYLARVAADDGRDHVVALMRMTSA